MMKGKSERNQKKKTEGILLRLASERVVRILNRKRLNRKKKM
jgi:hypothetical protein